MSSLLSASQKQQIQSVLSSIHDTFEKEIYIYTKKEIESFDASFNSLYGRSSSVQPIVEEFIKEVASARVHYINDQKEIAKAGIPELNLNISNGIIRLKVNKDTLEKILSSQKVEVDGVCYNLASDPKNIGPFQSDFYMIFLIREN